MSSDYSMYLDSIDQMAASIFEIERCREQGKPYENKTDQQIIEHVQGLRHIMATMQEHRESMFDTMSVEEKNSLAARITLSIGAIDRLIQKTQQVQEKILPIKLRYDSAEIWEVPGVDWSSTAEAVVSAVQKHHNRDARISSLVFDIIAAGCFFNHKENLHKPMREIYPQYRELTHLQVVLLPPYVLEFVDTFLKNSHFAEKSHADLRKRIYALNSPLLSKEQKAEQQKVLFGDLKTIEGYAPNANAKNAITQLFSLTTILSHPQATKNSVITIKLGENTLPIAGIESGMTVRAIMLAVKPFVDQENPNSFYDLVSEGRIINLSGALDHPLEHTITTIEVFPYNPWIISSIDSAIVKLRDKRLFLPNDCKTALDLRSRYFALRYAADPHSHARKDLLRQMKTLMENLSDKRKAWDYIAGLTKQLGGAEAHKKAGFSPRVSIMVGNQRIDIPNINPMSTIGNILEAVIQYLRFNDPEFHQTMTCDLIIDGFTISNPAFLDFPLTEIYPNFTEMTQISVFMHDACITSYLDKLYLRLKDRQMCPDYADLRAQTLSWFYRKEKAETPLLRTFWEALKHQIPSDAEEARLAHSFIDGMLERLHNMEGGIVTPLPQRATKLINSPNLTKIFQLLGVEALGPPTTKQNAMSTGPAEGPRTGTTLLKVRNGNDVYEFPGFNRTTTVRTLLDRLATQLRASNPSASFDLISKGTLLNLPQHIDNPLEKHVEDLEVIEYDPILAFTLDLILQQAHKKGSLLNCQSAQELRALFYAVMINTNAKELAPLRENLDTLSQIVEAKSPIHQLVENMEKCLPAMTQTENSAKDSLKFSFMDTEIIVPGISSASTIEAISTALFHYLSTYDSRFTEGSGLDLIVDGITINQPEMLERTLSSVSPNFNKNTKILAQKYNVETFVFLESLFPFLVREENDSTSASALRARTLLWFYQKDSQAHQHFEKAQLIRQWRALQQLIPFGTPEANNPAAWVEVILEMLCNN